MQRSLPKHCGNPSHLSGLALSPTAVLFLQKGCKSYVQDTGRVRLDLWCVHVVSIFILDSTQSSEYVQYLGKSKVGYFKFASTLAYTDDCSMLYHIRYLRVVSSILWLSILSLVERESLSMKNGLWMFLRRKSSTVTKDGSRRFRLY